MVEWRPAPGHEPTHEVSSAGGVRNIRTGRELSPTLGGRYLQVSIWQGDKTRTRRVHLLVCEAFRGPRPAGLHARHLDGDELNCSANNLAWGTRKENMQDTIRHGTNARIRRTTCPRGHALLAPNLVLSISRLGRRNCRACHVARGRVTRAARKGVALNLKEIADMVYSDLITEEHGANAFGPGTYEIRRQREQADIIRVVAD